MNAVSPPVRPRSRVRVSPHAAAEAVRAGLRDDAVSTLQKLVPALAYLPRDQVYNRILDNPELLDGCFQVFRANPGAFESILVRADRTPIESETDAMRCGRSLSQVIAMVVRTSARRYFRRTLKDPAPRLRRPHKPTLLERLGLVEPPRVQRPISKADRLYKALSDHLLYEWQARLIPYYAPLPEPVVRSLGARILDIRDPAELVEIAQSGRIPPTLTAPAALTHGQGGSALVAGLPATSGATPGGSSGKTGGARPVVSRMLEEELWAACEKANLGLYMNQPDKAQLRRMIAVAAGANASVFTALRSDVNLTTLQTAALLCAVVAALSPGKYLRLFGVPGEKLALDTLIMVVRREQFGLMNGPPETGKQALEVGTSVLRALRSTTLDF